MLRDDWQRQSRAARDVGSLGRRRRTARMTELVFVVPGRLDQLTGGYLFDRHIVEGLRARDRVVRVIELAARDPQADEAALAAVADGTKTVIDGLALAHLKQKVTGDACRPARGCAAIAVSRRPLSEQEACCCGWELRHLSRPDRDRPTGHGKAEPSSAAAVWPRSSAALRCELGPAQGSPRSRRSAGPDPRSRLEAALRRVTRARSGDDA